jgi:hypothetical protein
MRVSAADKFIKSTNNRVHALFLKKNLRRSFLRKSASTLIKEAASIIFIKINYV